MKSVIASMIGYFFALSSCLFCAAKSQAMPIFPIKQGILDLRNWDPRQEPIFQAEGKAAFYWEKFILIDAVRPEDKTFIDFPGPWNLKSDYPVHGYASVRIHVILPVRQSLSIQFPWLWSSAEIYADGKLLRKQGTIARNRNLSNPVGMLANLVQIFPRSKEFDIVLHMSNFEVPLSGHVERLLIGTPVGIQNVHDKNLMVDTFMLGAIFIMALYHIMLFLLRRQDFSSLYFGLFCIAMAAYLSVSSISSIFNVFYPSSFRSSVLIYDSSWTLALPIFYLYLMSMFPKDFSRNLAFINMGLGIAAALLMQFLDVYALVDFSLYYQVSLPFMMLQIVFFLIKAARSRRQGALGMLLSLSIVCAGVLLDMLMLHGSVSYSPVASASVFFFIFSQSYFLSRRFAQAFFRAESSESEVRKLAQEFKNQNIKISQLNETLEVRVEAQTRDIRSFMEHTPIAIFALQGHEALIHRDYSKQLELILECENIADQAILPLFFKGSSLSVDEYDQLVQALNAILDEPLIAFELNEGLLPRLLSRRNKQGQIKLFEAAWNPILGKDDRVEKILVALTDVSEIRSLQNTARERAETLTIIGEILAVKDVEFARFIRSCKGFMKQNWQLFSCADHLAPDREMIKILFLNLHTMKGSARHLGFKKLCDIFHEHENYYTQLIKYEFETWDLEKIREDLISIESSVLEYEKIAIDKLGRTMQDAHVVTVPILAAKQGFLELDHLARQGHMTETGLYKLYTALQETLYVSLADLMKDIFSDLPRIAKDLDKPGPELLMDVPKIMIRAQTQELIRNAFLHLLRNSLDHGIETVDERIIKGKDPVGALRLDCKLGQDKVFLWLGDDGRGLNLPLLLKRGREHKFFSGDLMPSPEQCAEMIFIEGISTAHAITPISGRGMGMTAVRQYIEVLGGHIFAELSPKGSASPNMSAFRLRIELPLDLFLPELNSSPDIGQTAS